MLNLSTNADEVADDLVGVVDEAAADAAAESAAYVFGLADPRTPRRSGRLAAGLRTAVVADGFDLVDDVPYAAKVDARTGFATQTLTEADEAVAAIYDRHLQERFDRT